MDLKAQYLSLRDEVEAAVHRVLDSCWFVLGEEVESFEAEFAAWLGARHAVAVNSGTSALHLALLAAGVGPGSEVITVPFTFVATVATIDYTGARPVLVDIDPGSFTMDVDQVEAAVTPRSRAIVPVHLYGQPADMDPILEIARHHDLVVIEDAAQAHGAGYKDRAVGTLGDMACFSFYPSKNLGAYGEGGAVTTNDPEYDQRLRWLRDWGQERKYEHAVKGYNYRMDSFQGAILKVKLAHIEAWNHRRREIARRYDALLGAAAVSPPQVMPYSRPVHHLYSVRHPQRDAFRERLEARGVGTGIHYPIPVHLQAAYRDLGYPRGTLPHSEAAAQQVLSLPLYPELSDEDVEAVARAVCEVA